MKRRRTHRALFAVASLAVIGSVSFGASGTVEAGTGLNQYEWSAPANPYGDRLAYNGHTDGYGTVHYSY